PTKPEMLMVLKEIEQIIELTKITHLNFKITLKVRQPASTKWQSCDYGLFKFLKADITNADILKPSL
ncbi:hypothetical protein V6248_19555, partial [Pseudoalteromonas agarivorans]|uniref:hypothetical protein n=1 Tax=Pseudoalteromonas agarivorans TaxID=176102 RepID=UPI00311EF9D1